jgi:hypothetical protein
MSKQLPSIIAAPRLDSSKPDPRSFSAAAARERAMAEAAPERGTFGAHRRLTRCQARRRVIREGA